MFSVLFLCLSPGELAAESVPFIRHWSRRRGRPWHCSQVCWGKGQYFYKPLKTFVSILKWFVLMCPSGGGQHDRVGQCCDRQRRPSFCHRATAHSGVRSNSETLSGPLTCPPAVTFHLLPRHGNRQQPVDTTQYGHFGGGKWSRSDWGGFISNRQNSLTWLKLSCLLKFGPLLPQSPFFEVCSDGVSSQPRNNYRTGAKFTLINSVNIPGK